MTMRTSGTSEEGQSADPNLARWARWRAGPSLSLDAMRVGEGRPAAFVPNRILVHHSDTAVVKSLVERYGARIVPPRKLPPRPDGLAPRAGVRAHEMPLPIVLHMPQLPAVPANHRIALRALSDRPIAFASESAERLLSLVAGVRGRNQSVGLDFVHSASTLPLLTATETVQPFPFALPAFTRRARVCQAWQLIEAFRQIRSTKHPLTVAILDGGFWLNDRVPGVMAPDTGSDLGASVYQLNLLDEGVGAGGASPNKCADSYACPWHGNGTASIATASVDNRLGAAGVGGTVALPVLMKTDLSISQVLRGVQICIDWGLDVLNMSFDMEMPEIFFPSDAWDGGFQYAADNGLIMVAAAGNDGASLPALNIRPATRTPGTITVGWLNGSDVAAEKSNYGSSVDIWAPGEGIPVMPDPDNPSGSLPAGTSVAAPFVSGIAAMMRAVNPSIDNSRAREIIIATGWKGSGRVNVGVDAFAAVLAAMGGRLPADEAVPNDTPATAAAMRTLFPGRLVPYDLGKSFAVLSGGGDEDWYKFSVTEFSRFDLQMNSYPLLGTVSVTLEPDDQSSQALSELVTTTVPGSTRLLGLLAPGGYKLHVRGSVNLYELTVDLKPEPLGPDMFEPNESVPAATRFHISDPPKLGAIVPVIGDHAPGSYNLSLHTVTDRDFFRVEITPSSNPLNVAVVRIARSDEPIQVVLFDATGVQLNKLDGVHDGHLTLPSAERAIFFVEISGNLQTRYTLTMRFEVDQSRLPGPLQNAGVLIPPDLGDPPFQVDTGMRHLLVQVEDAREEAGNLALASIDGRAIRADLIDSTGAFITSAVQIGDSAHQAVELNVDDLLRGTYFLRISAGGANASKAMGPLNLEIIPARNVSQAD